MKAKSTTLRPIPQGSERQLFELILGGLKAQSLVGVATKLLGMRIFNLEPRRVVGKGQSILALKAVTWRGVVGIGTQPCQVRAVLQ